MGIKSQKGATLLELIMLITIVSVGVFSFGGILANMLNISMKSTLIRKSNYYAEGIINRITAYVEAGNGVEFEQFINNLVNDMNGTTTAENYTINVAYQRVDNYWETMIHPSPFLYKRGFLITISVSHPQLNNPLQFKYFYPAIQNDYNVVYQN